jgi:single stranded DNA-binding protein
MNNTYIGRLGDDPALRFSEAGNAWCGVGFAIEVRKKVDGEWTSVPIWCDLKVFGVLAEQFASCTSKGSSLIVVGELQPTEYTNKQGETVKSHELIAQEVGMNLRWGLG